MKSLYFKLQTSLSTSGRPLNAFNRVYDLTRINHHFLQFGGESNWFEALKRKALRALRAYLCLNVVPDDLFHKKQKEKNGKEESSHCRTSWKCRVFRAEQAVE